MYGNKYSCNRDICVCLMFGVFQIGGSVVVFSSNLVALAC